MRQTITLNIGLEDNDEFALFDPQNVADWVQALLDGDARSGYRENTSVMAAITQSTEATAVVQYSAEDATHDTLRAFVHDLAAFLHQDAIAVSVEIDEADASDFAISFLAGPGEERWQPFDASKFDVGPANAGLWAFSNLSE